jgi:predicted nucleic acid-binding protein
MAVRVYLDLCALKRPFDDQSQGRIWIETQAVIRILRAIDRRAVHGCNSSVLEDENGRNTNVARRERVARLLSQLGAEAQATEAIFDRAEALRSYGLKDVDALHLAFAEALGAEYFISCDDAILDFSTDKRVRVRIVDPVSYVEGSDI